MYCQLCERVNREKWVINQTWCTPEELFEPLKELSDSRIELCEGLPLSKLEDLTLEQIKAETLIETLGQNVLLRSRQCLYAVYANSESTDDRRICSHCRSMWLKRESDFEDTGIESKFPSDVCVKEDIFDSDVEGHEFVFNDVEQLRARISAANGLSIDQQEPSNLGLSSKPLKLEFDSSITISKQKISTNSIQDDRPQQDSSVNQGDGAVSKSFKSKIKLQKSCIKKPKTAKRKAQRLNQKSEQKIPGKKLLDLKPSEGNLTCKICLLKYKSRDKFDNCLKRHRELLDLDSDVACPLCSARVIKMDLTDHFEFEHKETGRTCCVVCLALVDNGNGYGLRKHITVSHHSAGNEFLCPGKRGSWMCILFTVNSRISETHNSVTSRNRKFFYEFFGHFST